MKFLLSIFLLLLVLKISAQEATFTIPYEKDNNQTMTYDEVIEYCSLLDSLFMEVRYKNFGISSRGNTLPYLIIEDPMKGKEKLNLWIQAGIHPGESDGIDAGFLFLRDVLTKTELRPLLKDVRIFFLPVFNADGLKRFGVYNRINQNGPREMGWRTTALNLNLNRDFMKADAPEMQAWLRLFNEINPDFIVDCHTTDGADYQYAITYALDTYETLNQDLANWLNKTYVPFMEQNMDKDGFPVFPYVFFRQWHNPKSGLIRHASRPMLSHGYTILSDRPCLLIETHMLKPYNVRVEATRRMLMHTLMILAKYKTGYKEILNKADKNRNTDEFLQNDFPIHFQTSIKDSVLSNFKGFAFDTLTSQITGGEYYVYHNDKPEIFNLWLFDKIESTQDIKIPIAYLVPPEWNTVIERIKLHGITTITVQNDTKISAIQTKLNNVKFSSFPYENRFRPSFDTDEFDADIIIPKGSILIPSKQSKIKVLIWLLEAESEDSFLKWGFFNSIFEQKEYVEMYVMEPLAVEMFKNDPQLKETFEKKKKEDKQFAASQWLQMNWVYNHSLWADPQRNVYPVLKIIKDSEFKKLIPSK